MERDIRPITKRIALTSSICLLGAVMSFGPDQWARPVSADTPTPTPTPTTPARTPTPIRTSTPDTLATQIAEARATGTALAGQLEKEKQLADIRATATVIQGEINAARGTPTSTPTPDATARAVATRNAAAAQEVAAIQVTATAVAEKERMVPTAAPAPRIEQSVKKEEGGSPVGPILLITALLASLAGSVFLVRQGYRILMRRVRGEEERE